MSRSIEKPGRPTGEALAEILPAIVRSFPWPKSMRWGAASTKPDALRWVRPLRGIVCTLSIPHDATEIVPFAVDGLRAGDVTFGHRFMAPEPITVRRFEDYADALQKAKVVLDADRRKAIILADAKNLAFAQGLELVEDEGLLEEVAGLVEWPVALMGEFEPAFLDIPPEVIRATIRANQKCFVLRDGEGKLANRFILVANLIASDGGAAIAAGNARVVRARLADARHFFLTDLNDLPDYRDKAAKPLDQRLAKLEALGIIFHEKLGTQVERIERIETLARELAPAGRRGRRARRARGATRQGRSRHRNGRRVPRTAGPDGALLRGRAGRGGERRRGDRGALQAAGAERPHSDLAGVDRGRARRQARYARRLLGDRREADRQQGPLRVAARGARRDPDRARERPAAAADAAADRGGLGRSARHRIRPRGRSGRGRPVAREARLPQGAGARRDRRRRLARRRRAQAPDDARLRAITASLIAFFADRLKVYLRDKGARYDLIDAVFALPGQDDLLTIVWRVEALGQLLDTEDGKNLLAGYRRAANILRAEEKKDGAGAFAGPHDPAALVLPAEKDLADALAAAGAAARERIGREDFEGAMRALATLRAPVDAFFLDVTVNADDPALRLNRLRLLGELREAVHAVADFSKVAG